jgi:hypothetical protein
VQGVKRSLETACVDSATLATLSEPTSAPIAIAPTAIAPTAIAPTASEPTASEPTASEPTAKKSRNERKKYPDPCGFSITRCDDDVDLTSFVPVQNGDVQKALDMAYIISLGDGTEYEGTIQAVYPTVLSEEQFKESRDLILKGERYFPERPAQVSRVWHFSPPVLASLLEKKEAQAERIFREHLSRTRYTDQDICFACHPAPSGGKAKGCKRSDPPHKMYGDYAKGGCKFPKDLFQCESTSPVEAMSKRKGSLVDEDAEDSTHEDECLAE